MLSVEQLVAIKNLKNAGDPVAYYTYLRDAGVGYAALALGVASGANSGSVLADLGGVYALTYLKEKYKQFNGTDISDELIKQVKTDLMSADYLIRELHAGEATSQEIADYHYQVFKNLGIPDSAWTGDTLHRRINDQVWCLTCGQAEIGPDANDFLARLLQISNDFSTKFSAEDWLVFISDATFGKVLVNAIFDYGTAHPDDAAVAIVASGLAASLMPSMSSAALGAVALSYIAPDSWNQGLAVGALLTVDPRLTVEAARKLIDAAANSYSLGVETIACFNAIAAQLPDVCLAEFDSSNFEAKALDFIKLLRDSGTHGQVISPVTTTDSLATLAVSNVQVREMLLSGIPFCISWETPRSTAVTSDYNDYSPQFWLDREAWVRGLVADNISELTIATGSTCYLDQATGLTTTVGDDLIPSENVVFNGNGYSGSSAIDIVYGGVLDDTLYGGDGADRLYGGKGNDILDGGRGADILCGGAGDDILGGATGSVDAGYNNFGYRNPGAGNTYEGGTGNDTLRGTSMADVYLFNLGDGADTIFEVEVTGQPTGQVDVLRFGDGIQASEISISRNGIDVTLAHRNGTDSVTIKNWFTNPGSTANQIERVEFADGTRWSNIDLSAWALVVTGTDGNDTIRGVGTFNDTIFGGAGDDTLYGNDGADVLEGGSGNDILDGGRGADILCGGAGDDILGGATGSVDAGYNNFGYRNPGAGNTYEGGTGHDTLRGTTMADTYLFNQGDGADTIFEVEVTGQPTGQVDVLRFGAGIQAGDIAITRNGVDVVLAHRNGTDSVTIKNWFTDVSSTANQIERVEFADGTRWSNIDLSAWALVVTGTDGNDTIRGVGTFNDTLLGEAGDDLLYGNDGADVLEGGSGNDTLDGGRGADILRGDAGNDTLGGAAGSVDAGYDNFGYHSPGAGNTYEGGTGNDILRGTSLADVYIFHLGDGADTIIEPAVFGAPAGQADVINFGPGINQADIIAVKNGNDLVLSNRNGLDNVTVKSWFSHSIYQIEQISFADGSSWAADEVSAQALASAEAQASSTQYMSAVVQTSQAQLFNLNKY